MTSTSSTSHFRRALTGLLLSGLLTATAGQATTYVLMPDADLLDQASIVAEIEVLDRLPQLAGGPPSVDSLVLVHRMVKGGEPATTMVVRTPGGVDAGGYRFVLEGGVELNRGETHLLFLSEATDGSFSVLHGAMGAFVKQSVGGRVAARRRFGSARVLDLSFAETTDAARDYESFLGWLRDRARGLARPIDYLDLGGRALEIPQKYSLFTFQGKNLRWFEFDSAGTVPWRFRSAGSGGTLSSFRAGLSAWSGAGTPVRLTYRGSTGSTRGFRSADGVNGVLFGDPNNLMPGRFQCSAGGVLASGGFWTDGATGRFRGRSYVRIREADIVVNDGTGCLIDNNSRAAAELFAHELGHTLGIAHSASSSATMNASLHNDGRGASLRTDDKNALKALYGTEGGSPPDEEAPAPVGPKGPSQLRAWSISATKVRLRWNDNSRDETAFEIWRRIAGRSWSLWRSEEPNTVVIVATDAKAGTTYEFRVRARRGDDLSAYSNTVSLEMPVGLDAPRNLRAWALSSTAVSLRWRDTSSQELKFQLWVRSVGGEWRLAETLAANTTRTTWGEAAPGGAYEFRVRGKRGDRFGDYSKTARVTLTE